MSKIDVREKILDVAARLFYEQGYNLTGINQVIEEAAIAKASLYHHFASKTDLLIAYLEDFNIKWFAGLDNFLKSYTDPKQKLLAFFDYRIARQVERNYGGCAFVKINAEIETEPRVQALVEENKNKARAYIHKLVVQANQAKVLSNDALTDTIFLLMEGGMNSAAIFKNTADLESAKKIVKKLL